MSLWYNIDDDDIEVDTEKKEVNVYVTSDDQGSIYAILTFEQIAAIVKEALRGDQ